MPLRYLTVPLKMKRIESILYVALVAILLCSCDKDGSFENKVFINASSFKNEIRVASDEGIGQISKSVSVAMARPEERDVTVKLSRRDDLLDQYRQIYYDDAAVLLPAENCNTDGLETVIREGDVSSNAVELTFTGLDRLDYDKVYVMPLVISADNMPVLERSSVMYFVIKEASLVNFVADMKGNCAWPVWDDFDEVKDLHRFTMECLVNCHAFNNDSKILTIMGVEDHFLIRIGDVQIPVNQIQVACAVIDKEGGSTYRSHATDASLQLKKDRWYHLAVSFDEGLIKVYLDGKLRVETDVHHIADRPNSETGQLDPVYFESVNFGAPHSDEADGKPRCFWLGYSYDSNRCLDGMIAEARVWNRVLSVEEINAPNHFYKVYKPEDDASLLAYWKFDEGNGASVRDHSRYGHDLTADHNFVWYPVELPAKN